MNDSKNAEAQKDIAIIEPVDKERVKSQIYEIRGYRVMLDSDIAEYFGVETGALNRSMKRNIKRFPESFCFQLTQDEYLASQGRAVECGPLRCQSGTSNSDSVRGGRRYLPYAYTEQGVAMLTSTLHTDRAIRASIRIMEAFVEMARYLQQSRQLLPYEEMHHLSHRQDMLEADVKIIKETMVTKESLSDLMKPFNAGISDDEILILDGQPFKADLAYQKIYRMAKKSIVVIDDYIGIKTIQHLVAAKKHVKVTIISDNKGRQPLRQSEYDDFEAEYPDREISFVKSENRIHDRYIILDYDTDSIKVYHCGASSKDAGRRITTISEIKGISEYESVIRSLLSHPALILR